MKNLTAALDESFIKASKKIIMGDNNTIITVKNFKDEDFKVYIENHLLGKVRFGISPEFAGDENKVLFGGVDIDCPDLSIEEKYQIALDLQEYFTKNYRLIVIIEKSKSKGFHLFLFFKVPLDRFFIKNLIEKVVTEVTTRKITNGDIEVFPKGNKGNALFFPLFGMFSDENTLNQEFFEDKKSCFVALRLSVQELRI